MKTLFLFIAMLALSIVTFGAMAEVPTTASLTPLMPSLLSDALPAIAFGGLIINKANLSAMFTAFKSAFNTGFRGGEALWPKIATLVPSTTSEEKYGWLGQFPRLREWLGDRQVKNLALHDYSIKNKKFEATIGVQRDTIEDDTYGLLTPMFQEMGHASNTHPDELIFALLEAGFTDTCYDGQFYFDTDHPVNGASVSNMQAGGGDPWFLLDGSRPLKPLIFQKRRDYALTSMDKSDDDNVFMRDEYVYGIDARVNVGFGFWQQALGSKATLDKANFDAAMATMMAFKSDEGRPLGVKPNILIVGPGNRAAAKALIEVQKEAGGADNPNYKAVEVIISPWLT